MRECTTDKEKKSGPTGRQQDIRALAGQIAKDRLVPLASECDRNGFFPGKANCFLREAEIPGLIISGSDGGVGEGRASFARVVQEIAGGCVSTALGF